MKNKTYLFIGDLNRYIKDSDLRKNEKERLLKHSDSYFGTELSVTHPKGSSTYMAFAILNLSLSYLLTSDDRYSKEAFRWIKIVCGYEKWGHSHLVNVDLSASWNLFGLSLAYNWLYEVMDSDLKAIVKAKIELQAKILHQYALDNNKSGWCVQYLQNHNWINFTGLAAAGYALGNQTYIKASEDDFANVYPLLPEDGSDYEGVVYWRYGAMWLFLYAYLLKDQKGKNYFKSCKFLKNTFDYRLYQSAPDLSRQLNFGDTHDTHSGHPACIYRLVAKEYKNTTAQYYASYVLNNFLEEEASQSKVKPGILPEAFLEYLFYDPTVKETPLDNCPLFKEFPDLGLVSFRSDWTENAKVFSYKCGYPGGKKQWITMGDMKRKDGIERRGLSHNHSDHMSYIIVNGKNYFTCEDGYNRNIKEYHHSSLLVDGRLCDVSDVNDVYLKSFLSRGKEDKVSNDNYKGEITNLKFKKGLLHFNSDATGFYPENLRMNKVSRFVVSDINNFVAFIDTFDSDLEHEYSCLCNTNEKAKKISTSSEDNRCSYDYKNTGISYFVLPLNSDTTLEAKNDIYDVVSVMTTQEPDKVCKVTMQSLSHCNAVKSKKFQMLEVFTFTDVKVSVEGQQVIIGDYVINKQSVSKKN